MFRRLNVSHKFIAPVMATPLMQARWHSPALSSQLLNKISIAKEFEHAPHDWLNPTGVMAYDIKDAEKIEINHKKCECVSDMVALSMTKLAKFLFDLAAGFKTGRITDRKWINRIIFLESVAGIPGAVAGMTRHMKSLRKMRRDHGWIHRLMWEAENERMHLLTFLELRKPGFLFRSVVGITQILFFIPYTLVYMFKPKMAHRAVGYIEEEAVKTYSKLLKGVDEGIWFKDTPVPAIAVNYWSLGDKAKFRDLVISIRADEAGHRLVNHTFADMHAMKKQHETNPFLRYEADLQLKKQQSEGQFHH